MESDLSSKLKAVLSDPEAMAKISAIASNLGADLSPAQTPLVPDEEKTAVTPEQKTEPDLLGALSKMSVANNDPRIDLLCSLKPLLREEKRGRVDALVRALAIASMMKNFRK